MAAGTIVELARCAQGANFGDLNRALRNRAGMRAAQGTLPPHEQSAACKMLSPKLSLKGNWLKVARMPYFANGSLLPSWRTRCARKSGFVCSSEK